MVLVPPCATGRKVPVSRRLAVLPSAAATTTLPSHRPPPNRAHSTSALCLPRPPPHTHSSLPPCTHSSVHCSMGARRQASPRQHGSCGGLGDGGVRGRRRWLCWTRRASSPPTVPPSSTPRSRPRPRPLTLSNKNMYPSVAVSHARSLAHAHTRTLPAVAWSQPGQPGRRRAESCPPQRRPASGLSPAYP